jgi:hypothetical protein
VNLFDILRLIESHDFAAQLGIANSPEMLYEIARQDDAVKALLGLLADRATALKLLSHVSALIREQDDVRFRNSRDGAIAIYIWALSQLQPALGKLAAATALNAPRLWWARKAALAVTSPASSSAYRSDKKNQAASVVRIDDWRSGSEEQRSILTLTDPAEDLIREGSVADPSVITLKANGPEPQISEGQFSVDSDETPSVRNKVVGR